MKDIRGRFQIYIPAEYRMQFYQLFHDSRESGEAFGRVLGRIVKEYLAKKGGSNGQVPGG